MGSVQINFFVVEDHTLTNCGIRELLLEQDIFLCKGYAHSKDETLQKINTLSESQNLPDILILDLFLGSESGIDVLREIKRLYPSVKVVVYKTRYCFACYGKRSKRLCGKICT